MSVNVSSRIMYANIVLNNYVKPCYTKFKLKLTPEKIILLVIKILIWVWVFIYYYKKFFFKSLYGFKDGLECQ